jgi:hypothetical protein
VSKQNQELRKGLRTAKDASKTTGESEKHLENEQSKSPMQSSGKVAFSWKLKQDFVSLAPHS